MWFGANNVVAEYAPMHTMGRSGEFVVSSDADMAGSAGKFCVKKQSLFSAPGGGPTNW